MGTATYDLTEGPVTRQLLIFAYPFVLSNLLQIVYNLVDLVVEKVALPLRKTMENSGIRHTVSHRP